MRLEVIKVPRKDSPPDLPPNFPPLKNLHLELVEVKKKLKKNLPLLPKSLFRPPEKSEFIDAREVKAPEKKEEENQEEDEIISNLKEDDPGESKESNEFDSKRSHSNESSNSKSEKEELVIETKEQEEPQEQEEDEYAGLSPEEREIKEKEEYLWRFKILRKQHKGAKIPEWTEHSDLTMMKSSYQQTIKEVSLDANVEKYKLWLYYSWVGIEWAATQIIKIDLTGFAKFQGNQMNHYETLLVELGEKSYSSWGSKMPVEIRLIGFLLMQAGTFYLGKIIADKCGENVLDMFDIMMGNNPRDSTSTNSQRKEESPVKRKRKMRGPSITPEDVKEMKDD